MTDIGNLFILGDSYSTFEGYIPEGYGPYYLSEGRMETDVTKVEETWWKVLQQKVKSNLLLNCSWSGTTVSNCEKGWDGMDGIDKSFITRLEQLIEKGYFAENHVDTFLLFGGTNDSWLDVPVGELQYSDWSGEDLRKVLPSFSYLLHRITESLPEARVVCIINTELKPEIHQGFIEACHKYGVGYVELHDIAKNCGHPTIKGMSQIAEQVISYLNR